MAHWRKQLLFLRALVLRTRSRWSLASSYPPLCPLAGGAVQAWVKEYPLATMGTMAILIVGIVPVKRRMRDSRKV